MKSAKMLPAIVLALALANFLATGMEAFAETPTAAGSLAAPESFGSISNPDQRSAAFFAELGKVLTHPRCTNCHPATERPRQGDLSRLHEPPVSRGPDGFGLATMRCSSCHQEK